MLLFGHVGTACGLVHALDRRGTADLRVVALASLVPDLVDKPLWLFAPDFCHGWTRTVGHGLGALGIFSLGAAFLLRRDAWAPILAFASHLLLDRMWEDRHILLWPLDGWTYPPHPLSYAERWWRKLEDPWTLGGEALGLALSARLYRRGGLSDRARLRTFLRGGRLALPPDAPPSAPS